MGVLTYLEPQVVVVNTPTVLCGTYSPTSIAKVTVSLDDRFPVPVTLKPSAGTWQVQLDRGLTQAGVRSLRIRGFNASQIEQANRLVYITVNEQSLIRVDSATVEATATTWFKAAPISSSQLGEEQRIRINVGTKLEIRRYLRQGNHLAVELVNRLSPVGTFGYIYDPHAQLTVGGLKLIFDEARLPNPPAGKVLMWVKRDSKIKLKPESSAILPANQMADLLEGQVFFINGFASVQNHFRVTLDASMGIPEFGTAGYVFGDHVQLRDSSGKAIAYNSNATNLTVLRSSRIKKKPVDSSLLSDQESVLLPPWRIYGVSRHEIEAGHLKVTLTENFPGFGSTGYIFLDHIELTRSGQEIRLLPTLSYTGPTQLLVKQPATLTGQFDPAQVATVSLRAEDKFALPLTLDRRKGTWSVKLEQGFQAAGLRWLRLRAMNAQQQVIGTQVLYLTIRDAKALDVGELTLTTLRDTVLKVAPIDTSDLTIEQKLDLKAGQILPIRNYGLVDGHLKVSLKTSLTPVGDFGYVFEEHVQLKKGAQILRFDLADVPDTPISGQMVVRQNTFMKIKPIDSGNLKTTQKVQLYQGQTFGMLGYASTSGHFRVTLSNSIPGFGNIGYVYWRHVTLLQNQKALAYDPEALTLTIRQPTVLKRLPTDATRLSSADKITLPLGRVYGVDSYVTELETKHLRVALTEEIPGYGNTGYLYPGHIWLRQGGKTIDIFPQLPKRIELNVPYFSQRDNPRYYWSTCNVTSIAMVLYYYGVRPQYSYQLEDEMLQWILSRYGEGAQTDHSVLTQLIRAYGFESTFSTTRKWGEIDQEIAAGRPVILAGDFTATGHILTVIGYRPEGLIVNDPWGNALTGYTDTEGRKLMYPNAYLNDVCGPSGNIWAHFIQRR